MADKPWLSPEPPAPTTEEGVDGLFAEVFATPQGKRLRNYLADHHPASVTLAEITERVDRAWSRWMVRAP